MIADALQPVFVVNCTGSWDILLPAV